MLFKKIKESIKKKFPKFWQHIKCGYYLPGDKQKDRWKSQLLRGKKRAYESPHGDWSETLANLEMSATTPPCWVWQLQPLTGRSHQLRYEMSRHGFPIWGDHLYGSSVSGPENHIALRAVSLNLSSVPAAERCGLPEILEIEKDIPGFKPEFSTESSR